MYVISFSNLLFIIVLFRNKQLYTQHVYGPEYNLFLYLFHHRKEGLEGILSAPSTEGNVTNVNHCFLDDIRFHVLNLYNGNSTSDIYSTSNVDAETHAHVQA